MNLCDASHPCPNFSFGYSTGDMAFVLVVGLVIGLLVGYLLGNRKRRKT